jgi:hypothetical protein
MDPNAEVQVLKTKREALEAQLLKPDVDHDERMMIRQQIIDCSRELRTCTPKIEETPQPPDTRSLMVRMSDSWRADPIGATRTGLAAGAIVLSVWLGGVSCYMPLRHRFAPYTRKQINRRHLLGFQLDSPKIPADVKTVFTAGVLLYLLRRIEKRIAEAESCKY